MRQARDLRPERWSFLRIDVVAAAPSGFDVGENLDQLIIRQAHEKLSNFVAIWHVDLVSLLEALARDFDHG